MVGAVSEVRRPRGLVVVSDPYRDRQLACPACEKPLREYQQRLVCDACNGIMVSVADLAAAIEDLTSVVPELGWDHVQPGKRACPACRATMTACKIVILLEGETIHPKPELDRCDAHGVWFDHAELAKVLEKVAGKGHGMKTVSTASQRSDKPGSDGSWSAMFPYFGGRGGF